MSLSAVCMSLYQLMRMRTFLLSLLLLFSSFPSSHAGKHLVTSKQGRRLLVETSGTVEEKSTPGKERATNRQDFAGVLSSLQGQAGEVLVKGDAVGIALLAPQGVLAGLAFQV